jgi:predicted ATPase
LGFPNQAQQTILDARKLAEQIKHPLSSCYVFGRSNFLFASSGDYDALRDHASRLFQISQRYGFKNFEFASVFFDTWAKVMSRKSSGMAIDKMWRVLEAYLATGTILNRTAFLVLFAGACAKNGQLERGLAALNESFELAEKTGELWYQAEAFRVKGELLSHAESNLDEAENSFLAAQQIAGQQGARMLELRADVSLCHLWNEQGKGGQGRELLTQIYDTFTEGFDTVDLLNASALMERRVTY